MPFDGKALYARFKDFDCALSVGDMKMSYEPVKAAQLIAALIIKSGSTSINILKAMKLVYLSDRESIKRYGFPILDELRVSMPHGPVNSVTYSHINGEYDLKGCGWSDILEDRAHHNVALLNPSMTLDDLDELSDADLACIETVIADFGSMDQWQLVQWTHDPNNVPEWEDPHGSSTPIPLRRIMQSVGIDNPEGMDETASALRAADEAFALARVH